jgi:hypothetical protein
MDRRDFLQIGAALAAGAVAGPAAAQARRRSAAPAPAPLAPPPAPVGPMGKLKIDAYSRHLQWLRSPQEVADAVLEMGYDGLDITVRPYPGHVDPAKVSTDLAPFVNTIRRNGLQVVTMT